MKIKIEKKNIEKTINQIQNFIEKKDQTLITSAIYIKTENNNKIVIKATDNEIGLKKTIKAEVEKEGSITINGKKFIEIIKNLKNKTIEIKKENNKIIISQENSTYKLLMFNEELFPKFPETENMKKIKIDNIKKILKKIYPAIDNNNAKYELNGALIDLKENTTFVSTDTKRLALYKTEYKNEQDQIIIPKKAISEIIKIFDKIDNIFFNQNFLVIKNETEEMFTKLINGKFPNYERVIPKEYKYQTKIDKKIFLEEIKKISIISEKIKINISDSKIEIENFSDENLQAKTEIDITTGIKNFQFAVNSKYIVDFLNSIESDTFYLCLNEPQMPFILKENEDFLTVIMPLTI